ncbi:MAG TPA: flagellar basal body-associated protein FliL [Oxalobacteraceae bacterium]|jgi:flagellar FliL protein|nr:flagellar basal body-associated protein FliL [Oxalobacteraceae bacterium]
MATSASKTAPKAVPKAIVPPADAKEEAPVVKKSRKKRIVMALVVLTVIGAGGAGGWYYFGGQDATTPGAAADAKPVVAKPPVFVILDPFTVNLQIETSDQFLQVAMTLQVADQGQEDLIKQYMPQVRDRLLLLLSSKKASDILTIPGKKKLSEDIIAEVNRPFTPKASPQGVTGVFFTSFVIQ